MNAEVRLRGTLELGRAGKTDLRAGEVCDVLPPPAQCRFALIKELVSLVDGSNTGNSPALVVQNLVGDVRGYSEPRHSGHYRSTEVVKCPAAYTRCLVETLLCL